MAKTHIDTANTPILKTKQDRTLGIGTQASKKTGKRATLALKPRESHTKSETKALVVPSNGPWSNVLWVDQGKSYTFVW